MGPTNIAGLILNFGINTCFGLGGTKWGQQGNRGTKLMAGAIGFGVMDLILQLFTGGNSAPPAPVGISQADLDRSLDDLANRIETGVFNLFQSEHLLDVQAVMRQQDALWTQLQAEISTWTGQAAIDKNLWASWEKSFDFFDDEAQPGKSVCLKARDFVNTQVKAAPNNLLRPYQTLPLYMLAVGAYLNACQFAMLRQWQQICTGMNDPGSDYQVAFAQWSTVDYPAWETAVTDWQDRKTTFDIAEQARVDAVNRQRAQFASGGGGGMGLGGGGMKNWRNPPGGPTIVPFNDPSLDDVTFESPKPFTEAAPAMPPAPIGPPVSPNALTGSPYAQYIRDYVATAIDYAAPLLAKLQAATAKDAATRTARLGGLSVLDLAPGIPGSPAIVLDTIIDYRSPVPMPRDVADDAYILETGIARAGLAQQGEAIVGTIKPDDLASYIQTIGTWVDSYNNYCRPPDATGASPDAPRVNPFGAT